ncbi:MAG: LacI family DNA-binding transcriptional regulator, partial [Planctomycetota bacterium]
MIHSRSRSNRSPRIRIRDIADAAGVSSGTVSMALRDDTRISAEQRERLQALALEMGYRSPSQTFHEEQGGRKCLKRIGLVFIGESTSSPLLTPFSQACRERTIRLEVLAVGQEEALIQELVAFGRDLDGLVLTNLVSPQLLKQLKDAHIPICVRGRIFTQPGEMVDPALIRVVDSDTVRAARSAVHWLAAQGRKRIAFVGGPLYHGLYSHNWLDGYDLAHRDLGRRLGPRLIDGENMDAKQIGLGFDRLFTASRPPDAFITPHTDPAEALLLDAEKRGLDIPRTALVFGVDQDPIRHKALLNYPRIAPDAAALCHATLNQLEQQVLGAKGGFGQHLVPCRHHSFEPLG